MSDDLKEKKEEPKEEEPKKEEPKKEEAKEEEPKKEEPKKEEAKEEESKKEVNWEENFANISSKLDKLLSYISTQVIDNEDNLPPTPTEEEKKVEDIEELKKLINF